MTGHQTNGCIPWALARGMHALKPDLVTPALTTLPKNMLPVLDPADP